MHGLKCFSKPLRLKLYSACLEHNHNLHLYNELLSPLFPHLPFSIVLDVLSYELFPIFSTSTSSRCLPPCSLVARQAWWPGKLRSDVQSRSDDGHTDQSHFLILVINSFLWGKAVVSNFCSFLYQDGYVWWNKWSQTSHRGGAKDLRWGLVESLCVTFCRNETSSSRERVASLRNKI